MATSTLIHALRSTNDTHAVLTNNRKIVGYASCEADAQAFVDSCVWTSFKVQALAPRPVRKQYRVAVGTYACTLKGKVVRTGTMDEMNTLARDAAMHDNTFYTVKPVRNMEAGQGMAEYIIVLGILAVIVMLILVALGPTGIAHASADLIGLLFGKVSHDQWLALLAM